MKYCPIMEFSPCLGDKCAWWDGERCGVLGLVENLAHLTRLAGDDDG